MVEKDVKNKNVDKEIGCLYTVFNSYEYFGGAERISLLIADGLRGYFTESVVLSNTPKEKFHSTYTASLFTTNFFSFKTMLKFNDLDIVLSHHRKITTFLVLFRLIFRKKFRLIHVAHNEFYNLKYLTLFPKEIIAVSKRVKLNLIEYFKVDESQIRVIYNGIEDLYKEQVINNDQNHEIRVLYPARVTKVKQQIDIVRNLKGKLLPNVRIYFAGNGPDIDLLKEIIKDDLQFEMLGFVDIKEIISDYDYILLFSKVEGLPTSLIESCMFAKPIICNDVGGNLEILEIDKNGYFANTYEELIQKVNSLPNRNSKEYKTQCLNSRQKYLNSFTLKKMIDNYINLIAS